MDNKQVTAEWIAQQRKLWDEDSLARFVLDAKAAIPELADALEASMRREAEKDAEISRLKIELSRPESYYLLNKIIDLTADRDAANKRADAVQEIDLRPLQPGYMGVCTTDDEDGIQIRKASHKHPQGRGYLDDDEDVQDVVVIRFADTAQVLAVVDRLLVLADAMAEKTRTTSANTDAPTGAGNEGEHA